MRRSTESWKQSSKIPLPRGRERARLGIISALAGNDSLTFNDLKRLLKATDGNLSVHARKLEEAGYISCRKSFAGRIPRTDYRLTASGRRHWSSTCETWRKSFAFRAKGSFFDFLLCAAERWSSGTSDFDNERKRKRYDDWAANKPRQQESLNLSVTDCVARRS